MRPSQLFRFPAVVLLALCSFPTLSHAELIGHDGFDYRGSSMNGQEG
ncbi:MAG: hypothetical protein JWL81_2953, partial [Verrucomicrobiales bacterium]|nr:hypothetical protein [Verrucomicrobiales bacterium]